MARGDNGKPPPPSVPLSPCHSHPSSPRHSPPSEALGFDGLISAKGNSIMGLSDWSPSVSTRAGSGAKAPAPQHKFSTKHSWQFAAVSSACVLRRLVRYKHVKWSLHCCHACLLPLFSVIHRHMTTIRALAGAPVRRWMGEWRRSVHVLNDGNSEITVS